MKGITMANAGEFTTRDSVRWSSPDRSSIAPHLGPGPFEVFALLPGNKCTVAIPGHAPSSTQLPREALVKI